jgi:hypothetical protein
MMNREFAVAVAEYRECLVECLLGKPDRLRLYREKLPTVPYAPPISVSANIALSSVSRARTKNGTSHLVVEEWDQPEDGAMADSGSQECSSLEKGKLFSSEGPAPYIGDILANKELVWADDVWTPEKEANAISKLADQAKSGKQASEYWRRKYVKDAGRYWHFFYQRNEDHFYKDRHYLHVVFPELLITPSSSNSSNPYDAFWFLLEIGSGVGNAIWPLLELNSSLRVSAMDFAKSAIDLLNKRALQPENVVYVAKQPPQPRVWGHMRSIVDPAFQVPPPTVDTALSSTSHIFPGYDVALCMFVLSAIAPEDHRRALQNIYQALRGSRNSSESRSSHLLIRDYGRYDEAQLRFKGNAKLDDNFYVRQDGTCAYFFTLDELIKLAEEIGFHCEESYYIHRQYANRQQKQARYRVWIHLKFSC